MAFIHLIILSPLFLFRQLLILDRSTIIKIGMNKNPLLSAAVAFVYIIVVSSFMFYGGKFLPKEDSVLAPITLLSLFTLSAAFMGYIFLFNPLQLYLDGKKKEAVNLFTKTLLYFGLITVVIFIIFFSGIFKSLLS